GAAPCLLLCGHPDTVGIAGMTIPPFEGGVEDDRMLWERRHRYEGRGWPPSWRRHERSLPMGHLRAISWWRWSLTRRIGAWGSGTWSSGCGHEAARHERDRTLDLPRQMRSVASHGGRVRRSLWTTGSIAKTARAPRDHHRPIHSC